MFSMLKKRKASAHAHGHAGHGAGCAGEHGPGQRRRGT